MVRVIFIIMILMSCSRREPSSNKSNSDVSFDIKLNPISFLLSLKGLDIKTNKLGVSYSTLSEEWVMNKANIEELIILIDDSTKVPCVNNIISSYSVLDKNSTIGKESQLILLSYINETEYPGFFPGVGNPDSNFTKDIMDWKMLTFK